MVAVLLDKEGVEALAWLSTEFGVEKSILSSEMQSPGCGVLLAQLNEPMRSKLVVLWSGTLGTLWIGVFTAL